MFLGIFFTAIVSFTIGVFSLFVGGMFLGIKKVHQTPTVLFFCLFWFCLGFAWLTTALVSVFHYFQFVQGAFTGAYVAQAVVGGALVLGALFIQSVFMGRRTGALFVGLYSILFILFMWTLFTYGVHVRIEQYFADHFSASFETLIIFSIMFVPVWLGSVMLLARSIVHRHEYEWKFFVFYVLGAFSITLLGIAGFLDEMGIVANWAVPAVRLVSLVASVLALAAVRALQDSDELVI